MDEEVDSTKCHGVTLSNLIDTIQFSKNKKKKAMSETESISSNPSTHTIESDMKEKSKNWTEDETETLEIAIRKYGTDFHILSTFFPKKTKNQIKNKYKQLMALKRKEDKQEGQKLQAIAKMFNEIEEKEEEN